MTFRSRVADIENALINTNDFIDNDIAPSVQANTDSIKSLENSIDDIENTLTCSGSAELDVCGCPFGFTYYHGDCVASDEKAARNWIDEFNEGYQVHVHDYTTHYFAYETNITDHNLEEANKASGEFKRLSRLVYPKTVGKCITSALARFGLWYATHIPYAQIFDWRKFTDERLRRQFQKLLDNGNSLNAEDSAALSEAQNKMSNIYATGRVGDENRCLRLEAGGTGEVK